MQRKTYKQKYLDSEAKHDCEALGLEWQDYLNFKQEVQEYYSPTNDKDKLGWRPRKRTKQ